MTDSGQDDGLSTAREVSQERHGRADSAFHCTGGKSSVLRLRGLPFAASNTDVQSFFSGFETIEVYICRRDGRSTGEAYVVLQSAEAAEAALTSLNKHYMGNRYIELFEAAEADLAAVKKVLEDTRLQGFVVRLRGLPYSATALDVSHFFEGVRLAEDADAIVFAQSVDGRPTGEAYVELADEQALSLAMTRHKELMGNRYIEIFNSSKVDKLQALQQARFHMQASQMRRGRWHVLPAAASASAGTDVGQLLGPAASAEAYGALPNPDQLADVFNATHITSPAARAVQGSAPTPSYTLPMGGSMIIDGAMPGTSAGRVLIPTATTTAGHSASEAPLSLAAPAALSAGALPILPPQGAMMFGPEGQLPPFYYMHPAQGMVWGGQPGVARPSMPINMVPMVPMTGGHLMPGVGPAEAAAAAARGQAPPAWHSQVHQQPADHQQPGYPQGAPHVRPPHHM